MRRDAVSWILLSLSHRLVSSSLHNGKHRQTRRERERREEDENRIGLDWIGSGTRWEGLGGVVARVLLLSPAGDGPAWATVVQSVRRVEGLSFLAMFGLKICSVCIINQCTGFELLLQVVNIGRNVSIRSHPPQTELN